MQNDPHNLLPPHDTDSEVACIASLIIGSDDIRRKIRLAVSPADFFYQLTHGPIFATACRMLDQGKSLDAVLLADELNAAGQLEDIGGYGAIATIIGSVFSDTHGEQYAARVAGYAVRRRGIQEARKLAEELLRPTTDESVEAIIQRSITSLWQSAGRRNAIEVFRLEEILHAWMDTRSDGKSVAQLCGCRKLDDYAGIFAFGKYTILAGRPSMGKSTALRWLLGKWASQGMPVGLVACEEDRTKIAGNYYADATNIHNDHLAYGRLGADEWNKIAGATQKMSTWDWYGVDTAFALNEVTTAVEMLATEKKCRVIGVDHIHLIRLGHRVENEQREIKEISQRLKELAKRFGVVLIAAAQLSRPPKTTGIPDPPSLTDLRASGAIEEHADAAIFLHREDYYRQGPKDNVCQWIIAKNRNGRRGMEKLRAELEHQRFVDDLPDESPI